MKGIWLIHYKSYTLAESPMHATSSPRGHNTQLDIEIEDNSQLSFNAIEKDENEVAMIADSHLTKDSQKSKCLCSLPCRKPNVVRSEELWVSCHRVFVNQQMKAFMPAPVGFRKVILATNIAETSVIIPGIKYVIDPGVVKARTYNAHTGIESLDIVKTSKTQALQRSGRAGCSRTVERSQPWMVYRLTRRGRTFGSLRFEFELKP